MTNAVPAAESRIHEFTTKSGADTIEVGRKLAGLLKPPQLMILRGDLGTGKTTLVKGIAQALDASPRRMKSPAPRSRSSMNMRARATESRLKLYHLDVYRLEGERQLETLGLEELLTPDALVLVEWGREVQEHSQADYWRDRHYRCRSRWRCAQDHGDDEGEIVGWDSGVQCQNNRGSFDSRISRKKRDLLRSA